MLSMNTILEKGLKNLADTQTGKQVPGPLHKSKSGRSNATQCIDTNKEYKVVRNIDAGWTGYITKFRNASDDIDFANLELPTGEAQR